MIPQGTAGGYTGKILRVNLTDQRIGDEHLDNTTLRDYLGGTGLGAKYLYDEVMLGVDWADPANRVMFFSGPLGGTRVGGSGTIAVVTKGPMTNLSIATQANGFFGAFMKLSGYDGMVVKGAASRWSFIYIHDGTAELRDASHLVGKGTWETEDAIKQELGKNCSVFSIGPAGENLVRFACLVGDRGHVASKGGVGAVMGAKKLKAIVAARGKEKALVRDEARLKKVVEALWEDNKLNTLGDGKAFSKWGTGAWYQFLADWGQLPVKNYTTTIFPEVDRFTGEWLRTHFETKLQPCWACRFNHCHLMKVTEGPYTGFEGEEPDYEPTAAMSSAIGQTDPGACIMLANLVDNLGIDANEVGWLVGLVMECYEKGLLSKDNLDGLEMNWGNAEATAELLKRTAKRKGIGDLLAEGTKRVAEHIGGEALKMGVYTLKGGTPRGSDHRGKWYELIDTCVSNTSTTESTARHPQWEQVGLPPLGIDEYDPITVTNQLAKFNGRRQFDDSLGVCGFCINSFQLTIDALNAITGWDFDISEAMQQGLRAVNLLRLFSFRHGLTKEMEAPSIRLGSAPADGPHKGISVMPHWDTIRRNYYQQMGWDPDTGKPLLGTLQKLGLGHLVE